MLAISTRVSFFPSKRVSYLFIRKDVFRNFEKILYRIALLFANIKYLLLLFKSRGNLILFKSIYALFKALNLLKT